MPLPPPPKDLLSQIKAKKQGNDDGESSTTNNALLAAIQSRHAKSTTDASDAPKASSQRTPHNNNNNNHKPTASIVPPGKLFTYNEETSSFYFDLSLTNAHLAPDIHSNPDVDVIVPLAPCIYRMTDYTFQKGEPILLDRCVNKLGVLRCLRRECDELNALIWGRLTPPADKCREVPPNLDTMDDTRHGPIRPTMEEEELGKTRFMELLSSCGVYQQVSELILTQCHHATERRVVKNKIRTGNDKNPFGIPQIRVEGLTEFLQTITDLVPSLTAARNEIHEMQTVSFHPGLGELFVPGVPLLCYPEGMEGTPLGVSTVQSWYDEEEVHRGTKKVKRRFVLVVEFLVSVGEELVFVAASEVFPEFPEGRNVSVSELSHRRLDPTSRGEDAMLMDRMQRRGAFYASVATDNHYLEYHPNAFFPIIGGWGNNAVRPLSKSGRVMVDVRRGSLEGHVPVRGVSDGMSDTVKEAMKLFDQSKRTGVKVPFRTAILPDIRQALVKKSPWTQTQSQSDSDKLWMAWPMLVGFSFTARCWGKILLSLPKPPPDEVSIESITTDWHSSTDSPSRPSVVKLGIQRPALGGVGECGNVNYIRFHDSAFEQLVLAEDKKELIRAVARNAGGGSIFDFDEDWIGEEQEEDDEIGLDVVANKGAASIFLLSGPPGKTLTAEAIAELLKKPLYVVTAGDLGTTASELEKSLGAVLDLCSTWDALVLIDEADIFLEARSSTEIQRNALVCVMLRLLEYYSGCLFLSSNRDAKTIDAAIASRITVMLNYPPLDTAGRAKVWKNLLELVPPIPVDLHGEPLAGLKNNRRKLSKYRVNFTEEDYYQLASSFFLNGRQIKNSIVLARALARERGVALSIEILQRAVNAVAGNGAAVHGNS
eukprot:CCRYP_019993-RA/>CCRYP_019993-RA protein AED:0.05 eAED:0.05 QI:87/0.5/0.33/1/1/1/3/0/879